MCLVLSFTFNVCFFTVNLISHWEIVINNANKKYALCNVFPNSCLFLRLFACLMLSLESVR